MGFDMVIMMNSCNGFWRNPRPFDHNINSSLKTCRAISIAKSHKYLLTNIASPPHLAFTDAHGVNGYCGIPYLRPHPETGLCTIYNDLTSFRFEILAR